MIMVAHTIQREWRQSLGTVRLVEKLLWTLEENHISYCHWKSNTAIQQILAGETDLDLLVARQCQRKFREILETLGFVEAFSRITRWHPDIEHHYGYDPD